MQTYPVLSPQGATILVYGHENGVTIVWRGGRPFKLAEKTSAASSSKHNGSLDDSVMIIDSDEETPTKAKPSAPFEDKPQFEDEEDDSPFPEVLQSLDLPLGTAVLHVAVLPMTPCAAEDAAWVGADILKDKIVFAVSCATNDAYVITLPLTPPSPASKARPELKKDLFGGRAGYGAWGESVVLLAGQYLRSDGIAMNIVKPASSQEKVRDASGAPFSRHAKIVVAAHTRESSGTLRLWDVSLDRKAGMDNQPVQPFQTEYLPSPITKASFNSIHTTQLLAVFPQHAVRVYDFMVPSIQPDDLTTGPYPSQGSWLLSLYQPFARPTCFRKPVLDAAWISHGRAVLVLLADGTWGIWDIDGASPTGPTILGKQSSGVRGGGLTTFSASGYLEGTTSLRSVATAQQTRSSTDFMPMTPHTRRDAAAAISSAPTPEKLAAVKGGITVVSLPVRGSLQPDESAVLWVGGLEHVCVIPGISRFWDAQVKKGTGGVGNMYGITHPTRMARILDLATGLMGERCCGVGAAVNFQRHKDSRADDGGIPIDVILRGESRIVFVREEEEGVGAKIGGVVTSRRGIRSLSGRSQVKALVLRSHPDVSKFDLTTGRGIHTVRQGDRLSDTRQLCGRR